MIGRVFLVLVSVLSFAYRLPAQSNYSITLPGEEKKIVRGHLNLGGKNPNGDTITVNSYFIELNGKPFIPVIGEFHYSRYPSQYWEESLLKMKAGGINVVASYVFWNIHERNEGIFDWSGNLDVRKFVDLCRKHNLHVIIRIGPFGHGEIRNGGIPDWLYGKPFEVRSNDPGYLDLVKKLYTEIGHQLKGYFFQENGPIIGIQLENEFQHSAAPWEITYPGSPKEYTVANRDVDVTHAGVSESKQKNEHAEYGAEHMRRLRKLANEAGMYAPIYTATGWGNAAIIPKGSIPVTAGYAYPFWAPPQPSVFYLYKDIHKNPDYSPVSYEAELYPSLPAELGSGIMPTMFRRPMVEPESIEPLMVRTLGSGSNGIGYYMYHGGSTPVFEKFYNEESGGLPKICYDFQAPIGEFGDARYHYHSLKVLHLFLESFGEKLAPMQTALPQSNSNIKVDDTKTLRFAVRSHGDEGFLFMHNFQDHVEFEDIKDVVVNIETRSGSIRIPHTGTFDLKKGVSAILPFNLDLDGVRVKSATVSPLTKLYHNINDHYVFVSHDGMNPVMLFEGKLKMKANNCRVKIEANTTEVIGPSGEVFSFIIGNKTFLVIPKQMALTAFRHKEALYFSAGDLQFVADRFDMVTQNEVVEIQTYPASPLHILDGATISKSKPIAPGFAGYNVTFSAMKVAGTWEQLTDRKYALKNDLNFEGINDIFLKIDYVGDRGMAFFDGLLVGDHFYQGKAWTIGLKRFKEKLKNQDMIFMFHPLQKDAAYLIDLKSAQIPDFGSQTSTLQINGVEFVVEYKATLIIN